MSIPPRWLDCPRKGKIIAGKFIPFKTPLGPRYNSEVPDESRFNVSMLLGYLDAMQQRMGLVIDLTKTDRFYDKRDFLEVSIGHYKLQCEGYGEAPNREQIDDFKRVCIHFFTSHPGEVIGIHCTHGYNRTGFLIIAYLVEVEDWSFEDAIAMFSQARPPGIYKAHYIEELASRYNDGNMADIKVPERPAWCLEEDGEDDEGGASGRKGKGGPGKFKGKRKGGREFQNENAKFMEGVPGIHAVMSPSREEIQHKCQAILRWEGTGFPGSQPVSMDVQNIRFLNEKPYRVTWKADGTRYLMYIKGPGEVFMVDRDNSVFAVPHVSFPYRKNPGEWVNDTLVDGEMVLDKIEGSNSLRPRYLIYDIMQFMGNSDVARCDHTRRLLCVQKELIEPREAAAQLGTLMKQREPFGIRAKTFWDVSETRYVMERFMPKLTHENDGVIFSPLDPYSPGQCNELLKWKPADLNTVDFRLNIVDEQKPGMLLERVGHLYVGGSKVPFGKLDLKHNKEAKQHSGRIVECCWDQQSGWSFMRVREDKSFPNSFTTATSVCKSIKQPVTKDWLLKVVADYRWRPSEPAPPPASKRPHPGDTSDTSSLMPPPKTIPPRR